MIRCENETNNARAFLDELELLCQKHGVQIAVSEYDAIQLWPLDASGAIYGGGVENFVGSEGGKS